MSALHTSSLLSNQLRGVDVVRPEASGASGSSGIPQCLQARSGERALTSLSRSSQTQEIRRPSIELIASVKGVGRQSYAGTPARSMTLRRFPNADQTNAESLTKREWGNPSESFSFATNSGLYCRTFD